MSERSRRGRDDDDGRDDDRGSRRRGSGDDARGSRDRDRDDDRGSRRSRDDDGGGDRDRGDRGRGGDRDSDPRGGRRGGREGGRRSSFQYQSRSSEDTRKRGEQSGGDFDKWLDDGVKMFKPRENTNFIRILPPTWKEAKHYGIDVWIHYSVGPDKQTYLCLEKMKGEDCPVCEERKKALKEGDEDYAKSLRPNRRILTYVLDRDATREGAQVWSMPWTIDRDLCKLTVDKRTGEALPIDHPEEGYDVEFERKGQGDRTEYIGLSIARRSSPLDDDRSLEFIEEHPLPKLLRYFDYDHIRSAFGGESKKGSRHRDDDDDDDDAQDRDLRNKEREGRGQDRGRKEEQKLGWESIHSMTFDELCSLVDDEKLRIDPDESRNDEELADWICDEMSIKKEKASRNRDSDDDVSSKMDAMRRRREID